MGNSTTSATAKQTRTARKNGGKIFIAKVKKKILKANKIEKTHTRKKKQFTIKRRAARTKRIMKLVVAGALIYFWQTNIDCDIPTFYYSQKYTLWDKKPYQNKNIWIVGNFFFCENA